MQTHMYTHTERKTARAEVVGHTFIFNCLNSTFTRQKQNMFRGTELPGPAAPGTHTHGHSNAPGTGRRHWCRGLWAPAVFHATLDVVEISFSHNNNTKRVSTAGPCLPFLSFYNMCRGKRQTHLYWQPLHSGASGQVYTSALNTASLTSNFNDINCLLQ